jgi:aconitate hydratase
MLPFIFKEEALPFKKGDYIFVPDIAKAISQGDRKIKAM